MALMTEAETVSPEIAQTERIGLGDLVIAGVLAALTWFFLSFWEFPGLYPGVWDEAVVATGVRPATSVLPGYWRFAASIIYSLCGITGGNFALKFAGHFSLALVAIIVYAVLREMLAFIMRARPQFSKRRTIVMQIASAVGSAAFLCADPVWTAGQCFSETTILIVLTLAAIEFFFVFLRKGAIKYAYLCAVTLGLLAAESPMGFLLVAGFVGVNTFVLRVMPVLESPFFNPALIAVGKWYMTFLFVAALIFGIALNSLTFIAHEGLSAVANPIGSLPLAYLVAYWGRIAGAADVMGWILLLGVAVLPFIVTIFRFPVGADEEMFLPYSTGMVFLICGVAAVAQSASLPALWFWTYGSVGSSYLLSIALLLSATTLAGAMTILGVDALCRNHARLARQVFGNEDADGAPDDAVESEGDDGGFGRSRATDFLRRAGLVVIPLFVILLMLPERCKSSTRAILALIRDAVYETVSEAGAAEYLFTDGKLDTAVELESARRGGKLKCLSLMGGNDAMAAHLRTRGMANDPEDMLSFTHDCGMGLRTWLRDKPARLQEAAVQVGFDLWKRDGKMIPPMGGMLSHPAGWPDEQSRERGVETARGLARRLLALYRQGAYRKCTDKAVQDALIAVQWRLARMCLYRGEGYDLAGVADKAVEEVELSKKLNEENAVYKRLMEALTKNNDLLLKRLTPREGLQLALVRADFTMGKLYAETILGADPEHPDANFAMGMYYLKERQYSRSEACLKRCLIRNPREPAVYNNLALVQMELGKFDAAVINVEKALEILPQSAQVLDTKKTILKKRDERNAPSQKR